MQNLELIKGSRYQRSYPEPYFCHYRQNKAMIDARNDIDSYFDKLYGSYDFIQERLTRYNNTRLQYLLILYYYRQNTKSNIHIVYKSIQRAAYNRYEQAFLYKTLWTDIKDFFGLFHADFTSTYKRWWFTRNHIENFNETSKFCDDYFKWLSQKLAEKGNVSFEEVYEKLKRML
jgi:hypothetical protein